MTDILFHPIRPKETNRARAQRLLQASYAELPDYKDLSPDELLQRVYRVHNRCAAGHLKYQQAFLGQPLDLAVSDTFSYWFGASPCTGRDLTALAFQTAIAIARGADDHGNRFQMIYEIESLRVLLRKLFPAALLQFLTKAFSVETDLLYREDMEYLGLILLLAMPDWAFLRVARDMPSGYLTEGGLNDTAGLRPVTWEEDLALWNQVQQVLGQFHWEDQALCSAELIEDLDDALDDEDEEEVDRKRFMHHISHLIDATAEQIFAMGGAGNPVWEAVENEKSRPLTTRRGLILLYLFHPICAYYLDTYLADYLPAEAGSVGIHHQAELYGAILEWLHANGFLLPQGEPADSPAVSAYWQQQGPDREAAYLQSIPASARAVARSEVPLFQEIHAMADQSLRFPDRNSPNWLFGDLDGDNLAECAGGLYMLLREDALWVDTRLSALLLRGMTALSCGRRLWLEEKLGVSIPDDPPEAFRNRLAPLLDALYAPEKAIAMQAGGPAFCLPSLLGMMHNYFFQEGLLSREETVAAVWRAVAPAVPESDLVLGALTLMAAAQPARLERYRRQREDTAAITLNAYNVMILQRQREDEDDEDPA